MLPKSDMERYTDALTNWKLAGMILRAFCRVCGAGLFGLKLEDAKIGVCSNEACRLVYGDNGEPLGWFVNNMFNGIERIPYRGIERKMKWNYGLDLNLVDVVVFPEKARKLEKCVEMCSGVFYHEVPSPTNPTETELAEFKRKIHVIGDQIAEMLGKEAQVCCSVWAENKRTGKEVCGVIFDIDSKNWKYAQTIRKRIESAGYPVKDCQELKQEDRERYRDIQQLRNQAAFDNMVNRNPLGALFAGLSGLQGPGGFNGN